MLNGRWVLVMLLGMAWARVEASCGSASCSVHDAGAGACELGAVALRYEFEFVDQDQARIGSRAAVVGEIRGHHDEVFTRSLLHRVALSLGLSDRLAVEVAVPVVSREHVHIHHHHGADLTEEWRFTAVADPVARATAVLARDPEHRAAWTVTAGVKAPGGKRAEFNDDGDAAEPGILPGTGTWDFLGGTAVERAWPASAVFGGEGDAACFAGVSGRYNTPGVEAYRLGHELQADLGGVWPVAPGVGFVLEFNGLIRGRDHAGDTHEHVEATGGSFLYVTPGFRARVGAGLRFSGMVQVPVYRRVNAIQITAPWQIKTAVEYRFSAF